MECMPISIYYRFQQRFRVSAREAFVWCTNYAPDDHALMAEENAIRKVESLTGRTVILTDTFLVGTESRVEKQKLVQLYPEMLLWTSTHLSGPAMHSQFIYQIIAQGEHESCLDFTGIFLDHTHEALRESDIVSLTEKECKNDQAAWELLAKAMEQELCNE